MLLKKFKFLLIHEYSWKISNLEIQKWIVYYLHMIISLATPERSFLKMFFSTNRRKGASVPEKYWVFLGKDQHNIIKYNICSQCEKSNWTLNTVCSLYIAIHLLKAITHSVWNIPDSALMEDWCALPGSNSWCPCWLRSHFFSVVLLSLIEPEKDC